MAERREAVIAEEETSGGLAEVKARHFSLFTATSRERPPLLSWLCVKYILPLYNVGMRITDLHLMATLKNAFSSDVVSTNIGDIAPAGSARMLSISLPD